MKEVIPPQVVVEVEPHPHPVTEEERKDEQLV